MAILGIPVRMSLRAKIITIVWGMLALHALLAAACVAVLKDGELATGKVHFLDATALVTIGAAGVLALWMTLWLARRISRVLLEAAELVKSADVSRWLDDASGDELGEFCRAIDILQDRTGHKIEEARAVAVGDLTVDVEVAGERDQLGKAFVGMIERLTELVEASRETSVEVSSSAGQVSAASQSLSAGATEQAASLEEVSSIIQELSQRVSQNAANAASASEIAQTAKSVAERGTAQVDVTLKAIGEVAASNKQISKIIKVIDDIAFQTNLLALNAAVEAARAGQHGSGFSVVAGEVRNLATRSAAAAKDITDLIVTAVNQSERGLSEAQQLSTVLGELAAGSTRVAKIVSEISSATSEQASGIGQINVGVNQISQVTQQNTAVAEENSASAQELFDRSEKLNAMLSRFQTVHSKGQGSEFAKSVNKAITAHGMWKGRLRAAILTGKSTFKPESVGKDNQCDFGKWYYSLPEDVRQSATAREIQGMHATFHEEAGTILRGALAGNKAEARRLMAVESTFGVTSVDLVQKLRLWKISGQA